MKPEDDFFKFINDFSNENPDKLRLKFKKRNLGFDVESAITQIECRRKNSRKLQSFISNPGFLFPDEISAQQSTHQAIAKYHASLINPSDRVLDMTAGLGIDSLTMAAQCHQVTAIEINPLKADFLKHNAQTLLKSNLAVVNADSVDFLNRTSEKYDVIFVDPSRRDSSNLRVYNLRDCSPDVIKYRNLLIDKSEIIFIKASPMLDISQTLRDFDNIVSIHVVGVKDECKEVLIELNRNFNGNSTIKSVDLDFDGKILWEYSFKMGEKSPELNFAEESNIVKGKYLLEPSSMIMKTMPWDKICKEFHALKLDKSTHLFISDSIPGGFPGRVTKIEKVLTKKDRKSLEGFPATIISKNYPVSSDELRKSLKLKEGDENFIYATKVSNHPLLILSVKI